MEENLEERITEARSELLKSKKGALHIGMCDISDCLNLSGISKRYFGKTPSWFTQRVHHHIVNGKVSDFKDTEYLELVRAFREMSSILSRIASDIEQAKE